jgi:hypothetical protein
MVRVGNLDLPPDTTATPVELGWIAYVEWTTPAFYRPLLQARGPEVFGEAGVSRFFVAEQEQPIAMDAKPYATLVTSAGEADAGPFTRGVGRVELRPVVPDGGAKLVLREQMFPGWQASVGGRGAPIATGPMGFITLELPAGSHEVVLDYTRRTLARGVGFTISLLLSVFLLTGAIWQRGRA